MIAGSQPARRDASQFARSLYENEDRANDSIVCSPVFQMRGNHRIAMGMHENAILRKLTLYSIELSMGN